MEHLRCVVERITYQNADNGYTVLKCAVKNYSDLVTVVGTMPDTHVGSVLSLEGMWKMDAKYGRQFLVEKFEETLPATVYGIEKYLGSGLVKGVGPKFAKRIVEKFGKDTLDVIEETPDELLKVSGIGKVRVDRIKTSWQEQKEQQAKERKRKNDLKKTEEEIAKLEERNTVIDEELTKEEIYSNSIECQKLSIERAENEATLETLYERWEELAEEV